MSFYKQSLGHDRPRDYILGGKVEILRAGGGSCPVCGHPSGDCAGNHDTLSSGWDTSDEPKTHYVESDVLGKSEISGRNAVLSVLAAKGTWITKRRAEELGLI